MPKNPIVYKMIERDLGEVRDFYGRKLVNLAGVLDYRQRMQSLGAAKHVPRQYREAEVDTDAEIDPAPVEVFRATQGRYPPRNTWQGIAERIGSDERDLDLWRELLEAWKLSPRNQTNYGWMRDCFDRGAKSVAAPPRPSGSGTRSERLRSTR